MKLEDQLRFLGFKSLPHYLKSKHWRHFKRLYKTSGLPQACAHCGFCQFQLRHLSHERLGAELLTDVLPLCNHCQFRLNQYLKKHPFACLGDTLQILRDLGDVVQPEPESPSGEYMSDEEVKARLLELIAQQKKVAKNSILP